MSKNFIPELPCETLVRRVSGSQWRNLPEREKDGAWGVAIVKSVLDGVRPSLGDLSSHLGVDKDVLRKPYKRLSMNGAFWCDKIDKDRASLESLDMLSWYFYAGFAMGATGPWREEDGIETKHQEIVGRRSLRRDR